MTKKTKKKTGFVKYDNKKNRPELLPFEIIWKDAILYSKGAFKYDDNNWRNAEKVKYSRGLGAMLRHMFLWAMGEDLDDDTRENHLTAVRWNAANLQSMQMRGIGIDDRFKMPQKMIDELKKDMENFDVPPEWEALRIKAGLAKKSK